MGLTLAMTRTMRSAELRADGVAVDRKYTHAIRPCYQTFFEAALACGGTPYTLLGSIIDAGGSAPGSIDPPNIGKAAARKAGSHCFVIENRNRGMLQPPPGRTLIP